MKKLNYLLLIIILISCEKLTNYINCNDEICNYLMDKSFYVHEINGFYIVASNEVPTKEHGFNPNSLDIFNKVINLDVNFGLAHYELGKIYQIILNDEKAIYHFEKAKINESIEDLNFNLGMLYYNNN